ncbi:MULTISPECIES: EF-P lysine aminoacylase EpmA [Gammaproteobacteria]|uniref:EF-P lysine aminoacylase EpmA n=1 Tax=Gammaproteobacteria TaxID=1236 RepID=UPI000DD02040|nr:MULTISPECIES: EF-P lysine aminoacylase EpmA [Gammaproteobacteria]RTE85679.1 EF-P lysine aminoacylase GenX [Aliidiomarina sp. B3213]TCZ90318.1 EF-P lysine aminoacylase GenX [Lysobacter sp. N42]
MIESKSWQPSAALENIKARSALQQQIRAFFLERDVVEVETPILAASGVTEPHIANMQVHAESGQFKGLHKLYLQTSPEYAMKRLLCAGIGDCFQISKVFRNDEISSRHNVEFSMLEWYRLGFTDVELMAEIELLMREIFPDVASQYLTYQDAFIRYAQVDPLAANAQELEASLMQKGIDCEVVKGDRAALLDLLMSCVVEPSLDREQLTFVYHFPAEQASLAKRCEQDDRTAHRFELFYGGLELANGYWELQDPIEQRARFEKDNTQRGSMGLPEVPIDERFLAALESGLPACAGVAMGVDRLLMLKLGAKHIKEVLTFTTDSA